MQLKIYKTENAIDYDQQVDVAFFLTEHENSDEDLVYDLHEDISSHDLFLGSYKHVRSS